MSSEFMSQINPDQEQINVLSYSHIEASRLICFESSFFKVDFTHYYYLMFYCANKFSKILWF